MPLKNRIIDKEDLLELFLVYTQEEAKTRVARPPESHRGQRGPHMVMSAQSEGPDK